MPRSPHERYGGKGRRRRAVLVSYPRSLSLKQSLARVDGRMTHKLCVRATFYDFRQKHFGAAFARRVKRTTSGFIPRDDSSCAASPASAHINSAFSMPFSRALRFCVKTAPELSSCPILSSLLFLPWKDLLCPFRNTYRARSLCR